MNEQNLHVVLGTGPLGLAVAHHLAARGDRVRGNVAEAADARRACDGAAVVYHCANPPTRSGRISIPLS